jgi:diguanylate cyclase (GGDEF)-like protein
MLFHPAAIFRLAVPAVIIGGAALLRPGFADQGSEVYTVLSFFPYVACAVILVMSHLFGRMRLMLAAVALAVFYWTVQTELQTSLSDPAAARAYLGLSVCLPALFVYLLLIPESAIWSQRGLLMGVSFVLLAGAVFGLSGMLPQAADGGLFSFAPRPVEGYILSPGATLLSALAALAGCIVLLWRNSETDAALLACLVALYLLLAQLHLDDISMAMAVAASCCLLYGLLRGTHSLAYRDDLTGLLGRRALNERLKRLGRSFTIAMLDVDHFKRFNDTHGHDLGDEVLKLVASRLARIGGGGIPYRYGGEEFCIVFPRRTVDECADHLEALRKAIAGYEMSLRDRSHRPLKYREGTRKRGATRVRTEHVSVTVSIGAAQRSEAVPDADEVIKAADARLYAAKKAGRNRLVV